MKIEDIRQLTELNKKALMAEVRDTPEAVWAANTQDIMNEITAAAKAGVNRCNIFDVLAYVGDSKDKVIMPDKEKGLNILVNKLKEEGYDAYVTHVNSVGSRTKILVIGW